MLMRNLALALSVALPGLLSAQGMIIQRPIPCATGAVCVPGVESISHQSSHAQVVLESGVLKYSIGEVLRNTGGRNGEVDYMFPLPKFAAFQDLAMTVNGEMMAGEVLAADRARTIYESIVRSNRDPALVEWMGHGLLRTRIFPIAPGEEKRVEVRFQAVAQREGDAIRVDYFVGTRRGQGGSPNGTATTMSFSYPDSARYGAPYSPTHTVASVTTSRGKRTVTLSGSGSEMTLLLPVRNTRTASISVLSHAAVGEAGFALITLTPPQLPPRTTPRDVVFVLDVSGSMAGNKMVQAKEAGKQLLATLRSGDRFRIVTFSTGVSSFDNDFVSVTPQNVNRASAYLDSLEATGSTNFADAIDEALRSIRSTSANRLPLVLFVTDGAPTVGEQRPEVLAQRAADLRGRARVFTFGVGNDVKAELIETLAMEGRGTAQIVSANESVERAVSVVASRLTSPIVTDLRLQSTGVRIERMHPSDVTDLFAGQDVVILARYDGSGSATLNFVGNSADGPVRWTTTVNLPAREMGNSFVSRLWATQRVGFLSAERRKNGANPELDQEIRTLGERYSIPTMFTSYMVIEPGVQIGPDGRVINAADFVRERAAQSIGTGRAGGGGGRGAATQAAGTVQGGQQQQGQTRLTRADSSGLQLRAVMTTGLQDPTTGQKAAFSVSTINGNQLAVSAAPGSSLEVLSGKVAGLTVQGGGYTRALTAHESVKLGQSQLLARSEADMNTALAGSGSKRVGDRVFVFADSAWIDIRANDSLAVAKIKPYSEVYFQLLKAVPALSPVFSLGERVVVAGKSIVIRLEATGVEKLTASELEAIVKKW